MNKPTRPIATTPREQRECDRFAVRHVPLSEHERRAPAYDDSERSGEAHPDCGGPQ